MRKELAASHCEMGVCAMMLVSSTAMSIADGASSMYREMVLAQRPVFEQSLPDANDASAGDGSAGCPMCTGQGNKRAVSFIPKPDMVSAADRKWKPICPRGLESTVPICRDGSRRWRNLAVYFSALKKCRRINIHQINAILRSRRHWRRHLRDVAALHGR